MANNQVFPDSTISEIKEVDSTNRYLESIIVSESIPEGSVFFTNNQTAGIGYAGNKWESEPYKNLTASMVLYPRFLHPADQFFLTMVVSLAVCDTVNFFLNDAASAVKWPNDIYCGNRKIAGILIKNQVMGTEISMVIVGLGLNINQTHFVSAPAATSLKLISAHDFDVNAVLSKWHTLTADYYEILRTNKTELYHKYLHKLYLKDVRTNYQVMGKEVTATIKDIDQHGRLILEDDSGNKYECGLKEVVFPMLD